MDTPNTELIYSFVTAIIPAGSGEDAEADPVGTGPFSFCFLHSTGGNRSLRRMKITGRKDFLILMR